jgi:hypothetical protein
MGRTETGLDCAGVVILAYARAHGRMIATPERYPEREMPRRILMDCLHENYVQLPTLKQARAGDTLLIRTGTAITLAIYTRRGGAIFASADVGRVTEISRLQEGDFVAAFRLKGIE